MSEANTTWQIRLEGIPQYLSVATPEAVIQGLRDGDWEATDDVRGPQDSDWQSIEEHPVFMEIVSEMGPPIQEPEDDTRLDMNPLIDVTLVLLIFFILTTTYASLRRTLDIPPVQNEDTATSQPIPKTEDIQDRIFRVKITMDMDKPVVKIEERAVVLENLENELTDHVKNTGRKEMYVLVADDVPWGVEAKLYDAAKGAAIHQIHWPKGK